MIHAPKFKPLYGADLVENNVVGGLLDQAVRGVMGGGSNDFGAGFWR